MLSQYLTHSRSEYADIELKSNSDVAEFCDALRDKISMTFTITINEMKFVKRSGLNIDDGAPLSVTYNNIVLKRKSHVGKIKTILLAIIPNYLCTIFSLHVDYNSFENTPPPHHIQQEEDLYCPMAPQRTPTFNSQEEEPLNRTSGTTCQSSLGVGYETSV